MLPLPFGKGRKFANGLSGAANELVSGWEVSGITTFRSGFPIFISAAGNNLLTSSFGAGSMRPSVRAKLAFIDEDGNADSIFANSKYRELLPSDKDFTLMVMVMSPGYRQYPITSLRLQPGQEMQMDIPISKE